MAVNGAMLTSDYLAALYIVDEPVWSGLALNELTAALEIVKASLPSIPTMIIESD